MLFSSSFHLEPVTVAARLHFLQEKSGFVLRAFLTCAVQAGWCRKCSLDLGSRPPKTMKAGTSKPVCISGDNMKQWTKYDIWWMSRLKSLGIYVHVDCNYSMYL